MFPSKLVAPALLFVAGAVFGRVFGVKPLFKGAMTAATLSGMIPDTTPEPRQRRAVTNRPARKRVAAKRSKPTAA